MARLPRTSGFTLLECMIAMAVMVIGSLGALSLQRMGVRMNADARIMTRATALAQDLVNQMQLWDYSDARLSNSNTDNDANFADTDGKFEYPVDSTMYDHEESELASGTWLGVPTATARQLGFTRYWNVIDSDHDQNILGTQTGRRVAVIVRWEENGIGRRIVMVTFAKDPEVTN